MYIILKTTLQRKEIHAEVEDGAGQRTCPEILNSKYRKLYIV